jgi:hypothetical protein
MMKTKLWLVALSIGLLGAFSQASDAPKPVAPAAHELTMDNVAKIKVGAMTGEQVTQLLGAPYRSSSLGCAGEANGEENPNGYDEIWEYLGHDAKGPFLIHMEFDDDGVVRILAKVPQKGPIEMLAVAPKPEKPHQH